MTEEEHLDQLHESVEEAAEKAQALTGGLTEEQLLWKPAPKKWSVAGCFEHLILTGEAWHSNIRTAIKGAEAVRSSKEREYRPTFFGRFFLGMTGEKVRLPMPTHPMFDPGESVAADAPERFLEQQQELLGLIEDARGLNLQAPRVAFPQWPRMSLRLGEALALVVNHQHRHLQQVEAVMQEDGFPLAAAGVETGIGLEKR